MPAEPTPESSPRWGPAWRPELPDEAWARWDVMAIPEGLFVSARCQRCGRRQEWWPQDTLSGIEHTPVAIAEACRTKREAWLQTHQMCDRRVGLAKSLAEMGWAAVLLPAGAGAWAMAGAATGSHPHEVLVGRTGSGNLFVTELPRADVSTLFEHAANARTAWGHVAREAEVTEAMRIRETSPGLLSISLVTQRNGVTARGVARHHGREGDIELAASPLGSWTPALEGMCRPLPVGGDLRRLRAEPFAPHESTHVFLPLFTERLHRAIEELNQFSWDDSPEV